MKSEHRHELETNTLSRELAGWIERIKPHTTSIIVGIAVLIGLYLGAVWWSAERAEVDRRFWEEFQVKLSDADPEFEEIRRLADSDDYAGAAGQEWAYLTWADRQLLLASHDYLQSREKATDRLKNVAGVYDTLASGAANPEIANRARYGLARVYEMQNKIDDALRQYNLVRGTLSELAAERAERLQDDANRAAVAWLATAELPRAPAEVSNPTLGQAPDFSVIPPTGGSGGQGGPNLDLSRSLDEILGDLAGEEDQSERYDESGDEQPETSDADSPEATQNDEQETSSDMPEDAPAASPATGDEGAEEADDSTADEESVTDEPEAAPQPAQETEETAAAADAAEEVEAAPEEAEAEAAEPVEGAEEGQSDDAADEQ